MATITNWSLQSPDTTNWHPIISTEGVVQYVPGGGVITATPPVVADRDDSTQVRTLSISNAGLVTVSDRVADTGQDRAALQDANNVVYLAVFLGGALFFMAPQVSIGDLVACGLYGQETVPMLVKAIEPGPDFTATLTFVDAAPDVHQASTGVIPPFQSHMTIPKMIQIPKPILNHLQSDETVMLRSSDGSLVPRIIASLSFVSSVQVPAADLEVQYRLTGAGSWARFVVTEFYATVEVIITQIQEGLDYDLRFRSIGRVGQASDWLTIERYTVIGKTSPPPDVSGLTFSAGRLVWVYLDPPPDLAGFRVRVQVGTRTSWGDAMPLHDGLVSATQFALFRDSGQRTYLVKAVDTSGIESANAAMLVVDYGALSTENVAEVIDFKQNGFPGSLTNGSIFGGNLVAASDTLFWKTDGASFWTNDAALFWVGTSKAMIYLAEVTPPMEWLTGRLLLDLQVIGPWQLDYATESALAFWGDASHPFWSNDSALFWIGSPVFSPWPGELTGYTRQRYQFRLTTAAGSVQGIVSQLQAIFDMPDLEELLVNVALTANGTRLPLTQAFAAIKVVVPTPIDDGSGIYRVRVLDKEASGPLVYPEDRTGNTVNNSHADFLVKGY